MPDRLHYRENRLPTARKGFTSIPLPLPIRLCVEGVVDDPESSPELCLSDIAARARDLSDWTATIFAFGETAWREYRSAAWYVERLRAEGFTVEEGSAGMPTAFCADWRNGPDSDNDPVIGLYAEYDAVPGNCQAASTRREPRAGLGYQAGGHTDPHSALGLGGLNGPWPCRRP